MEYYQEPQDANDLDRSDARERKNARDGCVLYTVLPISYFIGSYRLLSFKNFPLEIGSGLAMDFFIYVLPMIFV